MKQALRTNGLTIVLLLLFAVSLIGQYITGWIEHNNDQRDHGQPGVTFVAYAGEGHFLEALFENWESEFLQMSAFVFLTIYLFQKGSAESKDPDKKERVDEIRPASRKDPAMPLPVRRGGGLLTLYSNSLMLALLLLFLFSFAMHAVGGLSEYNAGRVEHGEPAATLVDYATSSTFWFESFQNWQSEFLSIAVMVSFTVFLRQRGSPESKPVDTPHNEGPSD